MEDPTTKLADSILSSVPRAAHPEALLGPASAQVDAAIAEVEAQVKTVRAAAVAHLLRDGAPRADWTGTVTALARLLSIEVRSTRIAALLVEALTYQHGWIGLAGAARIYRQLIESDRPRLYPALVELRHAALWVQTKEFNRPPLPMPIPVWNVPITDIAGRTLGAFDLELLRRQVRRVPASGELESLRASLGPTAVTEWTTAANGAMAELDLLSAALKEDFTAASVPVPSDLDASFGRLTTQIRRTVDAIEAWGSPAAAAGGRQPANASENQTPTGARPDTARTACLPLISRDEAARRLRAVAAYFRDADPHSPIHFRLSTAARWLTAPVTEVLSELLSGDEQLQAVKRAIGIRDVDVRPPAGLTASGAHPGETATPGTAEVSTPPAADASAEPPFVQRQAAVQAMESVADYLSHREPHSLAKFPLAVAIKLAKLPIESIIDQLIPIGAARDSLKSELGIEFLIKSDEQKA